MITGTHAVIYSQDAEAVRAFLKDVIGWDSVDAGNGWLIFALPPAEIAVHPSDEGSSIELYLMCDDLATTMKELGAKGVEFSRPIVEARWGLVTAIRLPDGGELGLYEPRHASPIRS